jgi:peptidoglycan/LPS O-acetylase OafA/YrhL
VKPITKHIPYLDGLRGYAIISVWILHLTTTMTLPNWATPLKLLFGNGELGVDIFFAISGFLITTLLLRELEKTATISLRGFYERRVARILPAAFTYVCVIGVLTLAGNLALRWGAFVLASTFTWNYGQLFGLFEGSSDAQILNHFWSLSLEEQFYLFWPGCLLLFGVSRSWKIALTAVVALPVIRLLSYFLIPQSRNQLTEMFHTGVDQIFWGVLAAICYANGLHTKWATSRWFAPTTLIYGIFTVGPLALYVRYVPALGRFVAPTVYSSFGALLILWLVSGNQGAIRTVLESSIFRWVGLLSYSLYIWQQLFLVPRSPFHHFGPLNLAFAMLAAACSYYLVESPLRKRIRSLFDQ